jgi:hypothetical protein
MASTPAAPAAIGSSLNFQPAFNRVAQSQDCDCAFACIAMVSNKTLADVKQAAVSQFKFPRNGLYWIGEELICKLFASFGYVATIYKETTVIADLPDVAILMVDYDPETEIGRHVLFYRQRGSAGKPNLEVIIDPAPWVPIEKQYRQDVKGMPSAYFIGVHPMKPAGK